MPNYPEYRRGEVNLHSNETELVNSVSLPSKRTLHHKFIMRIKLGKSFLLSFFNKYIICCLNFKFTSYHFLNSRKMKRKQDFISCFRLIANIYCLITSNFSPFDNLLSLLNGVGQKRHYTQLADSSEGNCHPL